MPTLWLRFDEASTLPPVLDAAAKRKLEAVFDAAAPQSLWNRALAALGLPPVPDVPMLRWAYDAPYINWTALVQMVSGGTLRTAPREEGGFTYKENYRPSALWRLFRSQWRISRYVRDHTEPGLELPNDNETKLVESLALGCCVLALTMRIPSKESRQLHEGLADTAKASPAFRMVYDQIKAVQARRNLLSPAWAVLFQHNTLRLQPSGLPTFFWDEPPKLAVNPPEPTSQDVVVTEWRGIPVAGQAVTGKAILVRDEADIARLKASSERLVLICPLARPETVELFPYAAAVLYGDGGALCHACSIAREQNLTCITGLGQDFIRAMQARLADNEELILTVDPSARVVTVPAL